MQQKGIFPGGIIQCYPHPAIPRQVAPQQSLSLLHRTTDIASFMDSRSMIVPPEVYASTYINGLG